VSFSHGLHPLAFLCVSLFNTGKRETRHQDNSLLNYISEEHRMKRSSGIHFLMAAIIISSAALQAGCGLPGGLLEPTATASASPTPAFTPTKTPKPTMTPRPTATPNATATAQYNDMALFVQEAADKGFIKSTEGEYNRLEVYTEEWAQINWYNWTPTDFSPANFVFRAHMNWQSASQTPDLSGCGILFRLQDDGDHYGFLVTSDGWVHFILNEAYFNFGGKVYHGQNKSAGDVDFAMTAQDDEFNVYINGERLGAFYGHKATMLTGDLAYTLLSGTNKDFGTRCTMTNTELWTLK
jgi:hypothetical protein